MIETLLQDAATAVGNGTAVNVSLLANAAFQVSGVFVGTVVFEQTLDGTNWIGLSCVNSATRQPATSTTGPGNFQADVRDALQVRARVSAFTSGAISVDLLAIELLEPKSIPDFSSIAPSTITVGASPFVHQNAGSYMYDAIVIGGTVSAVDFSRDGVTYISSGVIAGPILLSPGDFVKVTYSVAPTMKKVPR